MRKDKDKKQEQEERRESPNSLDNSVAAEDECDGCHCDVAKFSEQELREQMEKFHVGMHLMEDEKDKLEASLKDTLLKNRELITEVRAARLTEQELLKQLSGLKLNQPPKQQKKTPNKSAPSKEIEILTKQITALKEELEAARRAAAQELALSLAQQKIAAQQTLEKQIIYTQQEAKKFEASIRALQTQLHDTGAIITTKQREITQLRAVVDQLQPQLMAANKAAATETSKGKKIVSNLRHEHHVEKEKNKKLRESLLAEQLKNAQLQQSLSAAQEENQQVQQICLGQDRRIKELTALLSQKNGAQNPISPTFLNYLATGGHSLFSPKVSSRAVIAPPSPRQLKESKKEETATNQNSP